jgi:hypothetical protein
MRIEATTVTTSLKRRRESRLIELLSPNVHLPVYIILISYKVTSD